MKVYLPEIHSVAVHDAICADFIIADIQYIKGMMRIQ